MPKNEKEFTCEICHCVTPRRFEGSEPNTCAECMPLHNDNNIKEMREWY